MRMGQDRLLQVMMDGSDVVRVSGSIEARFGDTFEYVWMGRNES